MDIPKAEWGDLSTALHNILPYGNDLAHEASDMLSNIVHHFGLCLKSEEWAPGAIYWAKQLNEYEQWDPLFPCDIYMAWRCADENTVLTNLVRILGISI